jgi:GTP-binding protein Era
MKSGFVSIFGKPNAGKSTLLNGLLQEKLAIVSPKVQTTRHRIKGFINKPGEYQIILSDTPGIIESQYKLHERMMQAVASALEDSDVNLLIVDAADDWESVDRIFSSLKLKSNSILVINKTDKINVVKLEQIKNFFSSKVYGKNIIPISALQQENLDVLLEKIIEFLPEAEAYYQEDDLTDLPTRFFVGELVREQIYHLLEDEIPYHTTVCVNVFKEQEKLIKIQADIIVQRESQKAIILGQGGSMIKKIGIASRQEIETFLQQKIYLQLFVKTRPKWRNNDWMLREYGY